MIKQEVRSFSSQNLDGTPMLPGRYVLTWLCIASVWFLAGMERMP